MDPLKTVPIGVETAELTCLYLDTIDVFKSREDYLARTGQEAPAYDYKRDKKMWRDSRPATIREKASRMRIYDVIAVEGPHPIKNEQGEYFLMPFFCPIDEIDDVNIPPMKESNEPGTGVTVPIPLRPLHDMEKLEDHAFASMPWVVNTMIRAAKPQEAAWNSLDSARLQRIEDLLEDLCKKLGVATGG
jgi:hypothetical protein